MEVLYVYIAVAILELLYDYHNSAVETIKMLKLVSAAHLLLTGYSYNIRLVGRYFSCIN